MSAPSRLMFIIQSAALGCLLAACGNSAPAPTSAAATSSSPGSQAAAVPSTLNEVIAAAKQEGTVNWAMSPDFGDGVPQIHDLVKSKYGVDLKINANGQLNYAEKVAKIVTEVQVGAPPSYDLIDISDSTLSPMISNKAATPIEWAKYLPEPSKDAVIRDTLLVTYDGFLMPAYNPKIISPDKAPKSYDDLLEPQWKGKVSVINTPSNWMWLAQPNLWGEQKLYDYMKKLYAQQPAADRYVGMLQRLLSGEYPICSGLDSGYVWSTQRKGQPIEPIYTPPIRDGKYGGVVPKGAPHPNAAMLIVLSEVTAEGQAIRDKTTAQTAAWVRGTEASKFVADHSTVAVDVDFQLNNQDRIVKQLDQIAKGAK